MNGPANVLAQATQAGLLLFLIMTQYAVAYTYTRRKEAHMSDRSKKLRFERLERRRKRRQAKLENDRKRALKRS